MAHVHAAVGRRLGAALALTAAVLVVELVAGAMSGSLALLSDAGHVFTDLVALGLAVVAVRLSGRGPDERRTYGYHRAGILVALANCTIAGLAVIVIAVEAVRRLLQPHPVQGGIVMVAALLAVAVNSYIAVSLHRVEGESLNVRAVMIHVLGDLAGGAGVLASGAVVLFTGWLYADALVSLAIAALITWSVFRLVSETLNVLMEGIPRGMDLAAVEREIARVPGVDSVHDLHVWTLAPEHTALSAHVVVGALQVTEAEVLVRQIEQRVCERFGIGHTTVQVESYTPCTDEQMAHGVGAHNHPHA